ncbi:hypothetical protein FA10DRAFT_189992 [Acaromyces ingoldii]|uniref:Uncharacterized protein n=1 Tax=Acaromyces ingoldii TaxID=215250 RepID=A0A316YFQ6_9BASI|nr:hypothetical protein FA10DRAFT_189992 [Acaromyces ingoldii]PWN86933.1 hypothetical protein FA10DRAFT_189992 [Acaromyces ingoldii]
MMAHHYNPAPQFDASTPQQQQQQRPLRRGSPAPMMGQHPQSNMYSNQYRPDLRAHQRVPMGWAPSSAQSSLPPPASHSRISSPGYASSSSYASAPSDAASSYVSAPSYASTISISAEQAQAAIERFGSPYATNADWRPSAHLEPRLSVLPSLGIGTRIKQRFARSAGDIWNPPCPCFVRAVHPGAIHRGSAFQPVRCKGKGELASDGFEPVFPGNILGPRDVSAADWHRFLQDLEVSGRLTGAQEVIAGVAPLTMHMGATGYFVTKAIKKSMARKREPVIFETVETWNERFFLPRGLDVYIRNKTERLTATSVGGLIAPLSEQECASHSRPGHSRTSSVSSDDSSASDSSKEKRQRKKREKAEKKERKRVKKENKKKGSLAIVIAPAFYASSLPRAGS